MTEETFYSAIRTVALTASIMLVVFLGIMGLITILKEFVDEQ